MLTIPAVSREYVRARVTATGLDASQIYALPVQFAFLTDRDAEPSSFITGSWEPSTVPAQARCLIGPGGDTTLTAGTYYVWVKIVSSPEQPVRQVGTLRVI